MTRWREESVSVLNEVARTSGGIVVLARIAVGATPPPMAQPSRTCQEGVEQDE